MGESGDIDGAFKYYEKSIDSDPKYAPAYYNKGVLHDKLLEHDDAIKWLDESIKIEPRKINPRFYKGIVLGKLGRHEEALNCFENICNSNPSHQDSQFHKGIELAELGQHEKAIKIFDRVLDKFGNNINLLYAKSRSKIALNQINEGLELLRISVKNSKDIKEWAKKEKLFEKIYDDKRFQQIVR